MTYRGSECPGLESNQHVLTNTAPSRRRVYQFRHLGKEDNPVNENEGNLLCDPDRVRTCDPLIKSQMLYQLSYGIVPIYRHRRKIQTTTDVHQPGRARFVPISFAGYRAGFNGTQKRSRSKIISPEILLTLKLSRPKYLTLRLWRPVNLPEFQHGSPQHQYSFHQVPIKINKAVYKINFDRKAVVNELEFTIVFSKICCEYGSNQAVICGTDKNVNFVSVTSRGTVYIPVVDRISNRIVYGMHGVLRAIDGYPEIVYQPIPDEPINIRIVYRMTHRMIYQPIQPVECADPPADWHPRNLETAPSVLVHFEFLEMQ